MSFWIAHLTVFFVDAGRRVVEPLRKVMSISFRKAFMPLRRVVEGRLSKNSDFN